MQFPCIGLNKQTRRGEYTNKHKQSLRELDEILQIKRWLLSRAKVSENQSLVALDNKMMMVNSNRQFSSALR